MWKGIVSYWPCKGCTWDWIGVAGLQNFFYFNRTPDKEGGFGTAQVRKTCTNLAQLIPTNPLNTEWLTFRVYRKNHFTKIFGNFWAHFISHFLSEASDLQIRICLSTDVKPLFNKCGITVYHVTVSCHCSTMQNIVNWEISKSEMSTSRDQKSGEIWIYFLEWTFSLMFPWYVSYSVSQDLYLSCLVLPSIYCWWFLEITACTCNCLDIIENFHLKP